MKWSDPRSLRVPFLVFRLQAYPSIFLQWYRGRDPMNDRPLPAASLWGWPFEDAHEEWETCSFLFPVGFLFAFCPREHHTSLTSLWNLVAAVVPGAAVESKEQFFQHSQNLSHTPPATRPAAAKKHRLIRGLGCQSHRALLQLRDASPSRTAPLLRGLSFSALCRPSF